jgi:hypothetical protein
VEVEIIAKETKADLNTPSVLTIHKPKASPGAYRPMCFTWFCFITIVEFICTSTYQESFVGLVALGYPPYYPCIFF